MIPLSIILNLLFASSLGILCASSYVRKVYPSQELTRFERLLNKVSLVLSAINFAWMYTTLMGIAGLYAHLITREQAQRFCDDPFAYPHVLFVMLGYVPAILTTRAIARYADGRAAKKVYSM